MLSTSQSLDSPATPQTAFVLPLNTAFPISPLNGNASSTPSPTLSVSSALSPASSRHPYINSASVDLTGGGPNMMEYSWYVPTDVLHDSRACDLMRPSCAALANVRANKQCHNGVFSPRIHCWYTLLMIHEVNMAKITESLFLQLLYICTRCLVLVCQIPDRICSATIS